MWDTFKVQGSLSRKRGERRSTDVWVIVGAHEHLLSIQSWVRWGEQVVSLEGNEVRREEPSWVEAVPRELSDFLSTSWLRGEDGYLWTVKKSLSDTESGALLLDLQTSELWKLKTYHLSHLDHDVSVTLIIARLDRNMYQEKTVPGEGKWARWDVLDRAMERSWIWADLGLKTLFCYYKPWRKLKKKKDASLGRSIPVVLAQGYLWYLVVFPSSSGCPTSVHIWVALTELGCLSKQNKITDPAPQNNLQNQKDVNFKMGGRHDY